MFLLRTSLMGIINKTIRRRSPFLPHIHGVALNPPPLWAVHRISALDRACTAVWGWADWAIVLLVLAGPTPNAVAIPVPGVVKLDSAPHDPHVAVTSLQEGGAVE